MNSSSPERSLWTDVPPSRGFSRNKIWAWKQGFSDRDQRLQLWGVHSSPGCQAGKPLPATSHPATTTTPLQRNTPVTPGWEIQQVLLQWTQKPRVWNLHLAKAGSSVSPQLSVSGTHVQACKVSGCLCMNTTFPPHNTHAEKCSETEGGKALSTSQFLGSLEQKGQVLPGLLSHVWVIIQSSNKHKSLIYLHDITSCRLNFNTQP